MKKILSIIAALAILTSIVVVAVPTSGIFVIPNYEPVDWQSGLAGDVEMPTLDSADAEGGMMSMEALESTPAVGTWVYDWYVGAISGNPYIQLRAVVGNAEVWVANDDALKFLPGDPRNDNPLDWQITDEMAQYIAEEFDSLIYPTDTFYFGAPFDRDGTGTIFESMGWPPFTYDWIETDTPQRVIIKIFNIHDTNFFDPTYPYYVVGFYSELYTVSYYNRNMIHIDNWRWWQRLGDEGTQWYPDTHPELTVTRPHVYESTVAHEYQHNIHRDWQPFAETWMNEGCSMYAEIVCGYGVDYNYFNSYFATPDNSLTIWGDQGDINILADYGVGALWTAYLSDHYGGGDIIRTYVQSGIPGIAGIDNALAVEGYMETFSDVYHDWRIANLIRTDSPGEGKYNYQSIDLNDPEIIPARTYDLNAEGGTIPPTTGEDFGSTISILGYDTYGCEVGSYGTDYIRLNKLVEDDTYLLFDGDDVGGPKWIKIDMDGDGDLEWYSTTAGGLADVSLIGEVTLPAGTVTLTIETYYDIEDFWDFGFVQVSTDGLIWTSLENMYTTYDHDPQAHPDIVANLPGLTGWSAGVISMDFDLSPYAEQTVLIRFRYMTDWYTNYQGWWIDNIAINGEVIEDADTTSAFEIDPSSLEPTDFMVTVIGVELEKKEGPKYKLIEDLTLDDLTEYVMAQIDHFVEKKGYVLLIVSPIFGPADYAFSITTE